MIPRMTKFILGFLFPFAVSAQTPAWEQVRPLFQRFCTGCHAQYADQAVVLGNRAAIYGRLKWIDENSSPGRSDMPPQGPLRSEFLRPANEVNRQAMAAFVKPAAGETGGYPLDKLVLPPGFKISLYARVPGARSMAQGNDGTLYVGTGGFANALDRVYRIRDWNGNGTIASDEVEILISGLNNPNGIAFRRGSLYVGEIDRILVFDNVGTAPRGRRIPRAEGRELPQRFPSDRHHGWKFIRFAPPPNDHLLYVPVGAPCNICKPPEPAYSAIHRISVEGPLMETVAYGVRNTVGFDFHPVTGNLWFTDNGRDSLGDDRPPDELNELTRIGEHFGYPYCHGRGIIDPSIDFDATVRSCSETTAPRAELGAHVAALGMRFYRGTRFPPEYRNQIFIAEHGSWNRSRKNGYRVTLVTVENGTTVYRPFITGWLDEATQKVWGRPVDIEELADGSLLVSDDGVAGTPLNGAIYRVQRE